jgi:hypothetical protein
MTTPQVFERGDDKKPSLAVRLLLSIAESRPKQRFRLAHFVSLMKHWIDGKLRY